MATAPIDLKLTDADKKKRAKEFDPKNVDAQPDYPYGTRLSLDDAALEKLGIDELPKAGSELHVTGIVKVTGTSQNADEKGSSDRRVELQITHLAIEGPKKKGAMADMYESSADAKDDE